jgi:NAD(P)-dependent dehydrogenase (short-subunit alcohol dehydrogenase family)
MSLMNKVSIVTGGAKGPPLGTIDLVEDVSHAVAFLVSDEARYITGEILDVSGWMLMD